MIAKVLTKQQIDKIHQASLTILGKVGVIIPHNAILKLFDEFGASVNVKENRVRIPENIVKELLSKAGRKFTIFGRNPNKRAEFGVNKRNYNSTGGETNWIESIKGARRYASIDDVVTASRFADALEQINIAGAMADPHEIPVEYRCVDVAFEMIKNTTKPITFWFYDRASAKYLVELVKTFRGDSKNAEKYPMFYPLFEPVSPLSFPFNGIDLLFETAKINMPVQIGPMAQMGMTAPATIAGTIAQENAEILAGICVTQLIREGTPVCYGGICHAFDMKTVQMIFGGPEQAIFSVAMSQMGRYYDLPVYINAGLTDSKRPDAQAGLECALTLSLGAAAGADIFGHFGICGDILVMQSEVISYVESVNREISFKDEDFALNVIEKVGPKGSFFDNSHTVKHFRKELWFPTILDREYFTSWEKKGRYSMEKRCRERKEEILTIHKPEPLEKDIYKDLELIVETAKKELISHSIQS
jgi:trimethylamine--corrinoid protein Co-methyltransferase